MKTRMTSTAALILSVSKIKMAMEIVSMETFFRDPDHVMEVVVYRISNVEIFALQEQMIVIVDRTLKFLHLVIMSLETDGGCHQKKTLAIKKMEMVFVLMEQKRKCKYNNRGFCKFL